MAQALSYAELEGYWIAAGGPPSVAPEAAAIALAESSGEPSIVQPDQPYETTGWGLWQITPGNSVPQVGIDNALLDPAINAQAAVAKYEAAGNSFSPWTTFTSGAYLSHLQQGVAPAQVSGDAAYLTGFNLNPLQNIPGISQAVSAGQETASVLSKLLSGSWWQRVGKMAIALLLGLVSLTYLFSKTSTGKTAVQAGEVAAMA